MIAGPMAEGIVDGLEFVDVEIDQSSTQARVAPGLVEQVFQFGIEAGAIGQGRQRVALGHEDQTLGNLALARDVL